ncbi:MAG: 5'-methylthioadenosine/S-adenosylhomocysteine nucleosidase [Clostridia bacterium]|nr:5'-methylthioadenosine/S-adenosylhomocysteine nucleosidase [Clostridia bacterium]
MSKNLKIGVIVADRDEYIPFVNEVSPYNPQKYDYYNREAISFELSGNEIICLNCGIGKVNAATAAAFLADKCDMILNYGLSGGISGVRRGEISLPDKYLEHDFDLTAIGYKPCEKPGQEYIYSADSKLLRLAKELLWGVVGTAVCGDRFVSNEKDREFLQNTFGAVSCDMETAAVASVCSMADIPFMAIRRISDDAGDTAVESYTDMNKNEGETLGQIFLKYLSFVCEQF